MFEVQRLMASEQGCVMFFMDNKLCSMYILNVPLECNGFSTNAELTITNEKGVISMFNYIEQEIIDISCTDFNKLEKYDHKIIHSIMRYIAVRFKNMLDTSKKLILSMTESTSLISSALSRTASKTEKKHHKHKSTPFWVYKQQQLSQPYKRR